MAFKHTTLLAVATVALMTGCAKHSTDTFTVGSTPASYKARHPIVIDEAQKVLDLPIASTFGGLSRRSERAVAEFGSNYMNHGGGVVQVMVPSGSSNAHAAGRAGSEVAAVLRKNGVPAHRIVRSSYDAHAHGAVAPVRLAYSTVSAQVKGCGQWPADLTESAQSRNYHNFGCASQANLASAVANPADLLGPRASGPIEPGRRTTVIGNYITGDRTAASTEIAAPPETF